MTTGSKLMAIIFLLQFIGEGHAQSSYRLSISCDQPDLVEELNQELDSVSIVNFLHKEVKRLQHQNYLLANLDDLRFSMDTAFASIHAGTRFRTVVVSPNKLARQRTKQSSQDEGKELSWPDVETLKRKKIQWYNNNGYPFAKAYLDSLRVNGDEVSGRLVLDKGPYIKFDSLKLVPGIVDPTFIARYLGVTYDKPFSESVVNGIERKLALLDYVSLKSPLQKEFKLGRGEVTVDLVKNKVNQFDGIIGLIPNGNQGTQITGELNLSLKNLFKRGRALDFQWTKLRERSQQLEVAYLHPLILGSPLNLEINYDQLKEDTLFSNRKIGVDVGYLITSNMDLSFRYQNFNGNKLSEESVENGDFDLNYYGLRLKWNTVDASGFPRRGQRIKLNAKVGAKKLNSPAINANNQVSNQYWLTLDFDQYIQLRNKQVLYIGLDAGRLINSKGLFFNDLFRLGGLRSIRGFNENFFFASTYGVTNLELRFQLESQSYFFFFWDQAVLEYEINTGQFSDHPTGLGAGFKLQMESGVFNLIYGLGRTENEGFSFDASKIHFGYTGNF